MFRQVLFLVFLILGLSACQADKQKDAANIRITPTHFEISELKFLFVSEVVNEVLDRKATQVVINACAAMPTQRLFDLMSELRNKYKGHIILGTTEISCVNQ